MISTEEMKQLEDNCGISKLQLMENAGRGIYNVLKEKFPNLKDKKILIIAYHGNNGGDGFVAARHLCDEAETDVLFIGDESKFKEEGKTNFKKIEENNKIQLLIDSEQVDFNDYDIIIDAILGTGVSGELEEPISSVIDLINESNTFKIAVDVPTGINPDTGEAANKALNPDLIITFHDIKQGLEKFKLSNESEKGLEKPKFFQKDKVVIVDIGIKKGD